LLNDLSPNHYDLAKLSEQIGCNGYFVFTFDSDDKDTLIYGRMFAPAIGINEDPVTGNANGPLGGYLIKNKIVSFDANLFKFKAKQGEKMSRLGAVEVLVRIENEEPALIQIGGDAVVIFYTEIEI
jgi:PhzF family phenazine biosynthesis protein